MSNSQPNPFSREGSRPSDGLGADPSSAALPPSWPAYPTAPSPTPPPSFGPTPGPTPPGRQAQPTWDPYGPTSTDPYGAPSPGTMQPGPQPGFDPQPTPPYGAARPAATYGSNPYDVPAYSPGYGYVTPYAASPYGAVPVQHPQAVLAMITGLLGLVICPFVGIAGLVLGTKVRRAIDAEPGRYSGRGLATAGFVLGIVSIVYAAFWILFLIAGVAGAWDS